MTATRKLFTAAVILTAGFGVARLMGKPAAHWYAPQIGAATGPAQRPATVSTPVSDATTALRPSGSARLVPDFGANNPYQVRTDSAASAPTLLPDSPLDRAAASSPQAIASSNDTQPVFTNYAPRAKLRDEAPRPLAIEQRDSVVAYAPPQISPQNTASVIAPDARSASADWRASGLAPAAFVQDATNVATIRASYSPIEGLGDATTVAPPPWPLPADESGPRMHIVVDGDSLERLAGRYLDDPRRGNEIYEANRELLASPDLLPIGAELVIPTSVSRPELDGRSPQSSVTSDAAIRAASHQGLVPMPRAQLLRPVPVE